MSLISSPFSFLTMNCAPEIARPAFSGSRTTISIVAVSPASTVVLPTCHAIAFLGMLIVVVVVVVSVVVVDVVDVSVVVVVVSSSASGSLVTVVVVVVVTSSVVVVVVSVGSMMIAPSRS